MMEEGRTREWATLNLKNGEEPGDPGSPQKTGSSFLEAVYGAFFQPAATFRQLGEKGRFRWGLWLYALVLLFEEVSILAGSDPDVVPALQGGGPLTGVALFFALYPMFVALVFVYAAFLHACALLLGGQGEFRGFFAALAFSGLPGILFAVLDLVTFPGDAVLQVLIVVWCLVLYFLAIRECYRLSTARALWIGVAPVAVFGWVVVWAAFWGALLLPGWLPWP